MTGKEIYDSLAQPPKDVLKQIGGGKLKNFTDINPQWRYEAMTEKFGLCGIGWYPGPTKFWTEQGANGEVLAFASLELFIKVDGEWSMPIPGNGGSKLVAFEGGKLVSNDEGYKMAETDAFSVAMKKIGGGADVYKGRWDGSKYTTPPKDPDFKTTKSTTELAGGDTTPDERVKLINLFNSKDANGKPVFTKEEIEAFKKSRVDKTAAILIGELEKEVKSRTSFNDDEIPFL